MKTLKCTSWFCLCLIGLMSLVSQHGLAQRPVYLDAGHGGIPPDPEADPGTVTVLNPYNEKDINLAVALKVKALLDMANIPYIMSRQTDTGVPVIRRAFQADSANCTTFVSIHHNSSNPGYQ